MPAVALEIDPLFDPGAPENVVTASSSRCFATRRSYPLAV
jgi:hypothetical protein